MSKLKLVKLKPRLQTQIDINMAKRDFKGTIDASLLESLEQKFDAKKWVSIFRSAKDNTISFYTKKKRDLGCDSLKISIVANRFVIAKKGYSNRNDVDCDFFEILPS